MKIAHTEWRLLTISNSTGDIDGREYEDKQEALRAMANRIVPEGCILTVEGQRTYEDGSRKWSNTGLVEGIPSEINKHWLIDHLNKWYASGDEPGYVP